MPGTDFGKGLGRAGVGAGTRDVVRVANVGVVVGTVGDRYVGGAGVLTGSVTGGGLVRSVPALLPTHEAVPARIASIATPKTLERMGCALIIPGGGR